MTITNGYATLAEYKAWNTIDTTNASDDVVIEQIIESISRQIDSICGRVFYVTTATVRYFNTDDSDVLYTDDISAATSFELATDIDGDGIYETVWASTDYNLLPYQITRGWPYNGIERAVNSVYSLSRAPRGNKVTALWGWAAVPSDIKTACLIGVDAEYHARNGQNLSTDTNITAAGVVITPRGLPRSAMDKLAPYKRVL
jgi:hypothetical protein